MECFDNVVLTELCACRGSGISCEPGNACINGYCVYRCATEQNCIAECACVSFNEMNVQSCSLGHYCDASGSVFEDIPCDVPNCDVCKPGNSMQCEACLTGFELRQPPGQLAYCVYGCMVENCELCLNDVEQCERCQEGYTLENQNGKNVCYLYCKDSDYATAACWCRGYYHASFCDTGDYCVNALCFSQCVYQQPCDQACACLNAAGDFIAVCAGESYRCVDGVVFENDYPVIICGPEANISDECTCSRETTVCAANNACVNGFCVDYAYFCSEEVRRCGTGRGCSCVLPGNKIGKHCQGNDKKCRNGAIVTDIPICINSDVQEECSCNQTDLCEPGSYCVSTQCKTLAEVNLCKAEQEINCEVPCQCAPTSKKALWQCAGTYEKCVNGYIKLVSTSVCGGGYTVENACKCKVEDEDLCPPYYVCDNDVCSDIRLCGAEDENECTSPCYCYLNKRQVELCPGNRYKCDWWTVIDMSTLACTADNTIEHACKCSNDYTVACPAGKACLYRQCSNIRICDLGDADFCYTDCLCGYGKSSYNMCYYNQHKCIDRNVSYAVYLCGSYSYVIDVCKCDIGASECPADSYCIGNVCKAELTACSSTNCGNGCDCVGSGKKVGVSCEGADKKCKADGTVENIVEETICSSTDVTPTVCKCASGQTDCDATHVCSSGTCQETAVCTTAAETSCETACLCAKNKLEATQCSGTGSKCVNGTIEHVIEETICSSFDPAATVCKCAAADASYCGAHKVCVAGVCSTESVCDATAEWECSTVCICASNKVTGEFCGTGFKCVAGVKSAVVPPILDCYPWNYPTDVCKCKITDAADCGANKVCVDGTCSLLNVCDTAIANCSTACLCAKNKVAGSLCSTTAKKCIDGVISEIVAPPTVCGATAVLDSSCACKEGQQACDNNKACFENACFDMRVCGAGDTTACASECVCATNKMNGATCTADTHKCVSGTVSEVVVAPTVCDSTTPVFSFCACGIAAPECAAGNYCIGSTCKAAEDLTACAASNCATVCDCFHVSKKNVASCSGATNKCVDGEVVPVTPVVPDCADDSPASLKCKCAGYSECPAGNYCVGNVCKAVADLIPCTASNCETPCDCTKEGTKVGVSCVGADKKCVDGEISDVTSAEEFCKVTNLVTAECKCAAADENKCGAGKVCVAGVCSIESVCDATAEAECSTACICATDKVTGESCNIGFKCIAGVKSYVDLELFVCYPWNYPIDYCRCKAGEIDNCGANKVCISKICSDESVCGTEAETNCETACICASNKVTGSLCENVDKKCVNGVISAVVVAPTVCDSTTPVFSSCACDTWAQECSAGFYCSGADGKTCLAVASKCDGTAANCGFGCVCEQMGENNNPLKISAWCPDKYHYCTANVIVDLACDETALATDKCKCGSEAYACASGSYCNGAGGICAAVAKCADGAANCESACTCEQFSADNKPLKSSPQCDGKYKKCNTTMHVIEDLACDATSVYADACKCGAAVCAGGQFCTDTTCQESNVVACTEGAECGSTACFCGGANKKVGAMCSGREKCVSGRVVAPNCDVNSVPTDKCLCKAGDVNSECPSGRFCEGDTCLPVAVTACPSNAACGASGCACSDGKKIASQCTGNDKQCENGYIEDLVTACTSSSPLTAECRCTAAGSECAAGKTCVGENGAVGCSPKCVEGDLCSAASCGCVGADGRKIAAECVGTAKVCINNTVKVAAGKCETDKLLNAVCSCASGKGDDCRPGTTTTTFKACVPDDDQVNQCLPLCRNGRIIGNPDDNIGVCACATNGSAAGAAATYCGLTNTCFNAGQNICRAPCKINEASTETCACPQSTESALECPTHKFCVANEQMSTVTCVTMCFPKAINLRDNFCSCYLGEKAHMLCDGGRSCHENTNDKYNTCRDVCEINGFKTDCACAATEKMAEVCAGQYCVNASDSATTGACKSACSKDSLIRTEEDCACEVTTGTKMQLCGAGNSCSKESESTSHCLPTCGANAVGECACQLTPAAELGADKAKTYYTSASHACINTKNSQDIFTVAAVCAPGIVSGSACACINVSTKKTAEYCAPGSNCVNVGDSWGCVPKCEPNRLGQKCACTRDGTTEVAREDQYCNLINEVRTPCEADRIIAYEQCECKPEDARDCPGGNACVLNQDRVSVCLEVCAEAVENAFSCACPLGDDPASGGVSYCPPGNVCSAGSCLPRCAADKVATSSCLCLSEQTSSVIPAVAQPDQYCAANGVVSTVCDQSAQITAFCVCGHTLNCQVGSYCIYSACLQPCRGTAVQPAPCACVPPFGSGKAPTACPVGYVCSNGAAAPPSCLHIDNCVFCSDSDSGRCAKCAGGYSVAADGLACECGGVVCQAGEFCKSGACTANCSGIASCIRCEQTNQQLCAECSGELVPLAGNTVCGCNEEEQTCQPGAFCKDQKCLPNCLKQTDHCSACDAINQQLCVQCAAGYALEGGACKKTLQQTAALAGIAAGCLLGGALVGVLIAWLVCRFCMGKDRSEAAKARNVSNSNKTASSNSEGSAPQELHLYEFQTKTRVQRVEALRSSPEELLLQPAHDWSNQQNAGEASKKQALPGVKLSKKPKRDRPAAITPLDGRALRLKPIRQGIDLDCE